MTTVHKARGGFSATHSGVLAALQAAYVPDEPRKIDVSNPQHMVWLRGLDRYERFLLLSEAERGHVLDAVVSLMKRVRNLGALTGFEAVCAIMERTAVEHERQEAQAGGAE